MEEEGEDGGPERRGGLGKWWRWRGGWRARAEGWVRKRVEVENG